MNKLLSVILVASVVATTSPSFATGSEGVTASSADVTAEVRRLMKRGQDEYEGQRWEAARAAYLEAWGLRHHFAVAANLADVEMHLGRYLDAALHLQFYLANLPKERADRRAEGEQRLAECRTHLGKLRLSVDVTGATVRLDGAPAPTASLPGEIWLEPKDHTLVIEASGYEPATRSMTAEAGGSIDLEVALRARSEGAPAHAGPEARSAPPPAAPAETPRDAGGGPSARTVVLVSAGTLALAALGTGVAYRVKSGNESDDAKGIQAELDQAQADPRRVNASCSGSQPSPLCGTLRDKLSSANDDENVSTAALITGGVLSAATLAVFFLWPSAAPGSPRAAEVRPWALPGGGAGADFRVRF